MTTWWTEFKPGRWVDVEAEVTCQRWPVARFLIHRATGKRLLVLDYEQMEFWVGWTGRLQSGERCERYVIFPMYLCHVVELNEQRYISASEMREP